MTEMQREIAEVVLKATRSKLAVEDLAGKDLMGMLAISSVDALEILISIEIAFGIEVRDEDLGSGLVENLQTLEAYVIARRDALSQA